MVMSYSGWGSALGHGTLRHLMSHGKKRKTSQLEGSAVDIIISLKIVSDERD